jgi:hypothetical protein
MSENKQILFSRKISKFDAIIDAGKINPRYVECPILHRKSEESGGRERADLFSRKMSKFDAIFDGPRSK